MVFILTKEYNMNSFIKLLVQKEFTLYNMYGRRGALSSGSSSLGSNPGQGYCALFLGKALYSMPRSLPR